jgi:WXG100 family type VII secretion target
MSPSETGYDHYNVGTRHSDGPTTIQRSVIVTSFGVQQESMTQAATKVEDASVQIGQHINTLRSEVEQMLGGGWQGEAAGAFSQVHQAFESQANKVNTALKTMHEALVATGRTYGTQEADQTSAIQGLAGQING